MPTKERYQKNRVKMREDARRRYRENREKELARQRKWREENLTLKRKVMKESARRRRAEHPEKTRAIQRKARENETLERRENRLAKIREWHHAHRAEMLDYYRAYKRDPEEERIRSRNRDAWYRQATGKFTGADIRNLFEKQKGKCANCDHVFSQTGTHRFHIDHVIPLKPKGALAPRGTNNPDNLQLLCRTCNLAKRNHLPEDWAKLRVRASH